MKLSDRAGGRSVAAAGMLALVLPPRLLPHPLTVDVAIGAAALLTGYALIAMGSWVCRRTGYRTESLRPWHSDAPVLLTLALLGIAGLRTRSQLNQLNQRVGLPDAPSSTGHAVLAVTGAVFAATSVLLLTTWLRHVPRRRLALLAFLPPLVWALASARSGPTDLKGTEFLTGTRDSAAITEITQRPADTPHRIYVPIGAATSHSGRAEVAVTRTEQAGGLNSAAVLIIVPTGSGWVNPRIARTVEELYDGDLTTVAVQYSTTPSWQAYLRGGAGVQQSASELVRAMRARIDRLPRERRPELLVYGESLGAWGLLPTLRESGSAVDAALLTGVPGNQRVSDPNTVVLNHIDDPVPDWKPWLDPISFWRISADAVSSEAVPVGHGHRYGPETASAWCRLVSPAGCS